MSFKETIKLFMELQDKTQPDKWFSIKEVSSEVKLSIDRTRKHLTVLVLSGILETKVDGWHNVYKFRR